MKCKYNDCGWCYCNTDKSNDEAGKCNNSEGCEEFIIQKAKYLIEQSILAEQHLDEVITQVKVIH